MSPAICDSELTFGAALSNGCYELWSDWLVQSWRSRRSSAAICCSVPPSGLLIKIVDLVMLHFQNCKLPAPCYSFHYQLEGCTMNTTWNRNQLSVSGDAVIVKCDRPRFPFGSLTKKYFDLRSVVIAILFYFAIIAFIIPSTARASLADLPTTASSFEITQFIGTWYEISSIPQFFERDCVATHATYTALPNGQIDVFNQCNDKTFSGRERSIHGHAWAEDATVPAKLRVQFFWPLSAPYWVLAIDTGAHSDAQWAITGSPDRKNLWILSRTKSMSSDTYQALVKLASAQGYDVSALRMTPQPND